MKVFVASKNPVKIKAVKLGFGQVFPNYKLQVTGFEIHSGVSDQPQSDQETLNGAVNRATSLRKLKPSADFWLGLEGGVAKNRHQLNSYAWVAVANKNSVYTSRTASFPLPKKVSTIIDQGNELGDAMAQLHNKPNVKQKEGAVGILTRGLISRTQLYTPSVVLALIPFIDSSKFIID